MAATIRRCSMCRSVLVLSLIIGVLADVGTFAAAQGKKETGKEISLDLTTTRLSTPIELEGSKYYRIRVVGMLKDPEVGEGVLLLDPNEKMFLNAFGDIEGGTKIAEGPVKIRMTRLRIQDPAGLGRKLYSVSGDKLPRLTFVVPASPNESYRLLVGEKEMKRVITLEVRIKRDEKKQANHSEPDFGGDAATAIKKMGGKVTTPDGAISIVDLSQCHQIRDIDLNQLKGLTKLQSLSLSGTSVTDEGLQQLKGLTSLRHLDLSKTKVTDTGLKALQALTSLQTLSLSETFVTDSGLVNIKGLTGLQALDLSNLHEVVTRTLVRSPGPRTMQARLGSIVIVTKRLTDEGLAHLKVLRKLQRLDLSNNKLTDACLGHLSSLASLQRLNLSGTAVTGLGLKQLKGLTSLQHLNLAKTPVADAGLDDLRALSALRTLSLSGTFVTDSGLWNLKDLTNLQKLDLSKVRVVTMVRDPKARLQPTDPVVESFTVTSKGLRWLKDLTKLHTLILRGTSVTDEGLENLRRLPLKTLDLSSTMIKGEGLGALNTGIQSLSLPWSVSDTGLGGVQSLHNLQTLDLSETRVTWKGLEYLKGLGNLQTLALPETAVAYRGLEQLQGLTKLQTITLPKAAVTDAVLGSLTRARKLHALHLATAADGGRPSESTDVARLDLSHTKVTDDGLRYLKALPNLNILALSGTEVTDLGLKERVAQLGNLHTLSLSETKVTNKGLEYLEGLNNLQLLDVSFTRVTDEGVADLLDKLPEVKITR
jgi:Leucine-rich repeat (LRR) protein